MARAAVGRAGYSGGLSTQEITELEVRLGSAHRTPNLEEALCLTDREAAHLLAVSPRSFSRYIREGRLRAVYLTPPKRTRRIMLADLRTFIRDATETRSTS